MTDGLEEYLGGGFGIALRVEANANGIRFPSDHYFLRIGAHRLRLPAMMGPGALTSTTPILGMAASPSRWPPPAKVRAWKGAPATSHFRVPTAPCLPS
ncbi:DUF4166 domain-containing protein [Novosphingobium lentum]|uniref:DUF4166 domain-containing protein n=1 Tax=Novosphingobium lentum TaxID=145287 RepID=UPI000A5A35C4|nr:DUF4166 domain-containing protein [Novosphingobium lentum]